MDFPSGVTEVSPSAFAVWQKGKLQQERKGWKEKNPRKKRAETRRMGWTRASEPAQALEKYREFYCGRLTRP